MKYSISYFYMIRFFKPNQIPISTAVWDPKWYHEFRGSEHMFIDKHGVINGIRCPTLNPQTAECGECSNKESHCAFKQHYKEYLNTINFKEFFDELEHEIQVMCSKLNIEDPEVVLMVYETPDNPCSERPVLQQWFKENGKELKEFAI